MISTLSVPGHAVLAVARMTRPDHLLLIVVVHGLGAAIAVGRGAAWDAGRVVAGTLAMVVVAASVHLANELADRETDALTTRTLFSGGSGATVDPALASGLVARATAGSMVLAAVVVAVLAVAGRLSGATIVAIVVVALLGWQYSLPPLALAWRGWGEVDNALLGGILLPVAGATTVAPPDPAVVVAVLPFGLLVFANLLATQWPDRFADAAVGKFTLATRWPPRRLRVAHAATIVVAAVLVATLPDDLVPAATRVGALVAVPVAAWSVATFTRDDRPLPTVATMLLGLVALLVGWGRVALGAGGA